MEYIYNLPFLVLEVPNLKIKKPSWFQQPSAMVMFALVLLSYFFVTGGKLLNVFVRLNQGSSYLIHNNFTLGILFFLLIGGLSII